MPLVFVHGVNVRRGTTKKEMAEFDGRVGARDNLFRAVSLARIVSPPAQIHIENPYWGDLGAQFRYDLVSVPSRNNEAFGPADELVSEVFFDTIPFDVAERAQQDQQLQSKLLLTLARERSLAHAVDAVVATAAVRGTADSPTTFAGDEDLANFAVSAAAYAASKPDLTWLTGPGGTGVPLETDEQFLEKLIDRVTAYEQKVRTAETFGGIKLGERLKAAARALGGAAKKVAGVVVGTVKGTVGAAEGLVAGGLAGAAAGGAPGAVVKALRPLATRRRGRWEAQRRRSRASSSARSRAPSARPRVSSSVALRARPSAACRVLS